MSENEFTVYRGMDGKRLDEIINGIRCVKAALIGDVCLDVYWRADMSKSELSRETPHFPLPVVEEWMSPGAGSNATANIAALVPASICLLGVVGCDWRGRALLRELTDRNIDTSGIVRSGSRTTNAYCKPLRKGISDLEYEDPRIDFANYTPLPQAEEDRLMEKLEQISKVADVLCVSDQFVYGCITSRIRDRISRLGAQGLMVVVDSRDRIGLYTDVILKPNEVEGFRAVYGEGDPRRSSFEEQVAAARTLAERNRSRVCMTLGPKGSVFVSGKDAVHIPSFPVKPPIDTCGAGDTFLAAFSCALAAGAKGYEAASFANMAADVTIRKLGTTGTASAVEIRSRYNEIRG